MTIIDIQLPSPASGHVLHVVLIDGAIVCRNCPCTGCSVFADPGDAFLHLRRHAEAGRVVRRGALEGLAVASAVLAARRGCGISRGEHHLSAAPATATSDGSPRPGAPLDVDALPDWWDEQRRVCGKGPSTCAAELRLALLHSKVSP